MLPHEGLILNEKIRFLHTIERKKIKMIGNGQSYFGFMSLT